MAKDRIKELEDFCKKNNRLPRPNECHGLRMWMKCNISDGKVHSIYVKYVKYHPKSFDERFSQLKVFCKVTGRLPQHRLGTFEGSLIGWARKNSDNPEVKELLDKYVKYHPKSFDERLKELEEFCKTNNRTPKYYNSQSRVELSLACWSSDNRRNPQVRSILDEYKQKKPLDFDEIKLWCDEHQKLPTTEKGRPNGYRNWIRNHKNLPEVQELIKTYGKHRK